MTPDQAWSDVGPWPSIGDDATSLTCAACGDRRTFLVRDWWCWSSWARCTWVPPVERDK